MLFFVQKNDFLYAKNWIKKERMNIRRYSIVEDNTQSKSTQKSACSICLDIFKKKKNRFILEECHHVFHTKCIIKWFRSGKKSCPLCRKEPTEEEEPVNISASQVLDGINENLLRLSRHLLTTSNTPVFVQNLIQDSLEYQLTFPNIIKCIYLMISFTKIRTQLIILSAIFIVAILAITMVLCLIGTCFVIKTYVFILNTYLSLF